MANLKIDKTRYQGNTDKTDFSQFPNIKQIKISAFRTMDLDDNDDMDMPVPIEGESEAVERISKLVEDAASMQKLAEEKTKATEQYFNTLRERLHNSTTFLSNIKKDIENIKLTFQNDEQQTHDQNSASYWEYNEKTDEELDQEMDKIKERLKELQNRVQTVKEDMNNSDSFETTMKKTVNLLENVSKGIYENKFE